jgi:hypothetical protein
MDKRPSRSCPEELRAMPERSGNLLDVPRETFSFKMTRTEDHISGVRMHGFERETCGYRRRFAEWERLSAE